MIGVSGRVGVGRRLCVGGVSDDVGGRVGYFFSFADMWLVVREANDSFSNSLNLVFVFFSVIPRFFEH
jgi:hypothetical protein